MELLVSKMQKRKGERQQWSMFYRRPNVSATVWEPVGAPCNSAREAMAYHPQINWKRSTGRGTANYYASL